MVEKPCACTVTRINFFFRITASNESDVNAIILINSTVAGRSPSANSLVTGWPGADLIDKEHVSWPDTKIIVSSADIEWCCKFQGVPDMLIEKPIADMSLFLNDVQGMLDSG